MTALVALSRLLASPLPAPVLAEGWLYAAWVAVDLRLLLFVVLISLLGATGTTLLFARRRDPLQTTATFLVAFTVLFAVLVLVFNTLASYPVFSIQSFFEMS